MMSVSLSTTRLLDGIRIVEIGTHDTLHIAGMLLADQGAEVIRIENAPSPSAFHQITDRAKHHFAFSPESASTFEVLIASADVLIEDSGDTCTSAYAITSETLTTLIRITIQPSLTEHYPAAWTEEMVSALNGLFEDGLSVGLDPYFYDIPIVATLGALYTINAVAQALVGRERCGTYDSVTVPLDRMLLFAESLTILIKSKLPTRWEPYRWVASPFMCAWKASDDHYFYLQIGMPRHLRTFLAFLERHGFKNEKNAIKKLLHPGTRRDPMMVHRFREAYGITTILQRIFLTRTADEWETVLGNNGLCCTRVRSFDEWRHHPQVQNTCQIIDCKNADGSVIPVPGALFTTSISPDATAAPAHTTEFKLYTNRPSFKPPAAPRLPLDGIKVLDLGRVIAGPYVGRLLAEAGAEVLHLLLRDNHLLWEEPFSTLCNNGKKSVAIDMSRPEARDAFNKIVATFKPDIIIHNFLEEAAKKVGCDYASCRAIDPDIICIDIKGYADGGPWSMQPGFEQNIQAASGILKTFIGTTPPRMLPVPVNDLAAGICGSFGALLTLLHREKKHTGGGRVTACIATSSILMHLHILSAQAEKERHATINHYFRASDGWFLLSLAHNDIPLLRKFPYASHVSDSNFDPAVLAAVYKKKPVDFWQKAIEQLTLSSVVITPHRSLPQSLKRDLAQKDPLFSYRFHAGIGMVLTAHSPLMSTCRQKELTVAPSFGADNNALLPLFNIDPAPFFLKQKQIPVRMVSSFERFLWLLRQVKWIPVIIMRTRGLRRRRSS